MKSVSEKKEMDKRRRWKHEVDDKKKLLTILDQIEYFVKGERAHHVHSNDSFIVMIRRQVEKRRKTNFSLPSFLFSFPFPHTK